MQIRLLGQNYIILDLSHVSFHTVDQWFPAFLVWGTPIALSDELFFFFNRTTTTTWSEAEAVY